MLETLTPREVVAELDRYIVGQESAKKAVAIALRNRWRRQQLAPELREEVAPRNILMIGPTGVGKTEIARRLAKLAQAPFIKIEASKYTEVGYVGRDVESMVRDLVDSAMTLVRVEHEERVKTRAERAAEERVLDELLRMDGKSTSNVNDREQYRRFLKTGEFDDRVIEIKVSQTSLGNQDMGPHFNKMEELGISLGDMFEQFRPKRPKFAKLKAREALNALIAEESAKLIDKEAIQREALDRSQNQGIIFIDEIDKVAGRESSRGPDVSREGVQRDLLPIVEGSNVNTRYGMVRTDHILFIAAGAFHVSKPSDLIPEFQGRFPIRVELQALTKADFERILSEPRNSLIRQYTSMLETEGVLISFRDEAISEIAALADEFNARLENIGARRLYTIMERVFEELSFHAPDMNGAPVDITAEYVRQRLADVIKDEDLSRYVL